MNLSLRTLTITLAISATLAFGQEVESQKSNVESPLAPVAAVEKTKEVVAAVQDVNNAAGEAVENVEGVQAAAADVPDTDEELDGVTVTAGVNELAMKQFAKSYSPDVVILEPERLREEVKGELERAFEAY